MPFVNSINNLFENGIPKVILLFGEERFLLDEDYEKLINKFIPDEQSGFDFEIFDGTDCEFNSIVDSCLSYPFVSERRVVVINNFDKLVDKSTRKEEIHNGFVKYLENPQETTCLLIRADIPSIKGITNDLNNPRNKAKAEKKLSMLRSPYSVLIKNFPCIEYPRMYETAYESWITQRFKSNNKTIEPSAVELLIAHTNPDLREISQEIEKLIILTGKNSGITIDDVTASLGTNRIYNVFELQKAVARKDLESSLIIMQKMLENERQEILIVTILTRFFVNLWRLDEVIRQNNNQYVIASSIGISPFFVTEYTDSLKRYKMKEIEKAIKLLAATDEKFKSSSTSPKYLLETLFIEIMA